MKRMFLREHKPKIAESEIENIWSKLFRARQMGLCARTVSHYFFFAFRINSFISVRFLCSVQ